MEASSVASRSRGVRRHLKLLGFGRGRTRGAVWLTKCLKSFPERERVAVYQRGHCGLGWTLRMERTLGGRRLSAYQTDSG